MRVTAHERRLGAKASAAHGLATKESGFECYLIAHVTQGLCAIDIEDLPRLEETIVLVNLRHLVRRLVRESGIADDEIVLAVTATVEERVRELDRKNIDASAGREKRRKSSRKGRSMDDRGGPVVSMENVSLV